MNRIRVLHPITRLIVGGAQENTLYTAAMLDPHRYQVEVLSGSQTGSEGSLIEEARTRGIALTIMPDLVRQISPVHDLSALGRLAAHMRRNQYSIVHTHSSKAGVLGRLAARLASVPIIIHTIHGWSFHDYMSPVVRQTYIFLERWIASFSDALIVVAKQDIDKGLRYHIGSPSQYHLIRSAIPLEEFNPARYDQQAIRHELGIPLNATVVGNVGRFSAQKNPLAWVEVAGRVARTSPNVHFLLVGDGPLRPQVQARLAEEGITNLTTLTGLRRDVPHLLAAMDIFLLTSLWEGLPRVLPQAMAMGLPIVANLADGTQEVIRVGENGFLCTPGDTETMTMRTLELVNSLPLRLEMGRQGRIMASKDFDLRQMIEKIEGLYYELLSRRLQS